MKREVVSTPFEGEDTGFVRYSDIELIKETIEQKRLWPLKPIVTIKYIATHKPTGITGRPILDEWSGRPGSAVTECINNVINAGWCAKQRKIIGSPVVVDVGFVMEECR